jgi:NADH-quinone oxidoreductase subunit N
LNLMLMTDEIAMCAILVLVLLADLMGANRKITGMIFFTGVLGLLAYVVLHRREGAMLSGAFVYDGLSWYSKIMLLTGAALTGLLSLDTVKVKEKHAGAYYMLLAASTLGMMVLVSSKELITMYIGLELATISLYALTAIYKKDDLALEGGIKYLILGAISSGMLLYGISLIYGMTRTTLLEKILFMTSQGAIEPVFIIGMMLVLLGVGFKLSMVPMHVWTPDVYLGAPTPVTAFISVASKAAGFIFAIRLFSYAFVRLQFVWEPILAIIAFLTMTIGNLVAIPQKNVKRLLAYSTISQAGYILVGFVGASVIGVSAVIFYLFVYTLTNIAAFAVVAGFSRITGSDKLEDYAGLAQKSPLLTLTFMLALLSLAGIPPLAGFTGKFYLFYAAMQKGYLWLVIAAALNSTVSLYYYLLVLKQLYIRDPKKDSISIELPLSVKVVLVVTIIGILAIGIMPTRLMDLTMDIAQKLFM